MRCSTCKKPLVGVPPDRLKRNRRHYCSRRCFYKSLETHKMTDSRFYRIYKGINERCTRKNTPFYKNYGGRGIKNLFIDFEQFKKQMYPSYLKACKRIGEKHVTIERIDVNGNYKKSNCKWIHKGLQGLNRRTNRMVTIGDETRCLTDWARFYGISISCVYLRMKRGFPLTKALTAEKLPGSSLKRR